MRTQAGRTRSIAILTTVAAVLVNLAAPT